MSAPAIRDADGLIEAPPGLALMEDNRARRRARVNRPKWEPKRWHPVYHEIVLLSCLGYSNIEIGLEKGLTKEHVSNVLNTPQAEIIRQIVIKRLDAKHEQSIETRFEKIAAKAMDRVEDVLNNDVLAEKNPLGIFDRAIIALKAANKIKTEESMQIVNNNKFVVSDEQAEKLIKAVQRSDSVRLLHAKIPVEVRADVIDPNS